METPTKIIAVGFTAASGQRRIAPLSPALSNLGPAESVWTWTDRRKMLTRPLAEPCGAIVMARKSWQPRTKISSRKTNHFAIRFGCYGSARLPIDGSRRRASDPRRRRGEERMTLLSCPFCGEKEWSIHHEDHNEAFVRCDYCGARGPWANTENTAKVVWNARVLTVPPSA